MTNEKEKQLTELTNAFCDKYLDEEYKKLCVKVIKRMASEDNVPFNRGSLENWAASILYALGQVNYLFNKTHEGAYVSRKTLLRFYHAKSSTITNKSSEIKKKYNLDSREYYTRTTLEDNPRLNAQRNKALLQGISRMLR